MSPQRRPYRRLYPFEIFTLVNFAIIYLIVARANQYVLVTIPQTFASFIPTLTSYLAIGCAVRLAIAAVKGNWRAYLRHLRTWGWISDALRLIFFGSLMVHTYFWIKLMAPVVHGRMYDKALWTLDQKLFFGFSPNIFFLNLFSSEQALRFVDWSYARIFFASMSIAFIFFLSAPGRRLRVAFMTGNSALWVFGAWLYMLVPSLGPVFVFPDVWFAYSKSFGLTQHFQALLMKNFLNVVKLVNGKQADVQLMFGIAAFPSLHVAFQTFAFLWMRRLWVYGQIVFGVFLFVIFIGSMVTGWHYLVDGLAGMVLAAICYWISTRMYALRHWRQLSARATAR